MPGGYGLRLTAHFSPPQTETPNRRHALQVVTTLMLNLFIIIYCKPLNSAGFFWPRSIVRNRSHVTNNPNIKSLRGKRSERCLAASADPFNKNVDGQKPHGARFFSQKFSYFGSGIWRTLLCPTKTQSARA